MKNDTPYVSWNTADIIDSQAKFLMETEQAETKDEAWTMASQDFYIFNDQWDYLLETLSEKLNQINPDGYWHCEAENFGWRNLSGYKDFEADDAKTFLSHILPKTECTFDIYIDDSHPFNKISITNYHHDSPCGEFYTVIAQDACEQAA